jgi:hypothetical protein
MEKLERLADEVRDSIRQDLDMRRRIVDTLVVTDCAAAAAAVHQSEPFKPAGGGVEPPPPVPPGRLQPRQVYLDYMTVWRAAPFVSKALQDVVDELLLSSTGAPAAAPQSKSPGRPIL